MWGPLVTAVAFAAFAAYYDSVLLAVSGLVVVCGTRIYEERYHAKWRPVWPEIIAKYEQAIAQGDAQRLDDPISK